MEENKKSSEEILKELVTAFSSLKQKMEDPNYIALSNDLRNLTQNQSDMKRDLKDLKKAMLNPFDGVIVNTNNIAQIALGQYLPILQGFRTPKWSCRLTGLEN